MRCSGRSMPWAKASSCRRHAATRSGAHSGGRRQPEVALLGRGLPARRTFVPSARRPGRSDSGWPLESARELPGAVSGHPTGVRGCRVLSVRGALRPSARRASATDLASLSRRAWRGAGSEGVSRARGRRVDSRGRAVGRPRPLSASRRGRSLCGFRGGARALGHSRRSCTRRLHGPLARGLHD